MKFIFSAGAIRKAQLRQYDGQGMGYTCARCGGYIHGPEADPFIIQGRDFFAIPRVPVEQAGKKAENCIIVCPECYRVQGQDGSKFIPLRELPHSGL